MIVFVGFDFVVVLSSGSRRRICKFRNLPHHRPNRSVAGFSPAPVAEFSGRKTRHVGFRVADRLVEGLPGVARPDVRFRRTAIPQEFQGLLAFGIPGHPAFREDRKDFEGSFLGVVFAFAIEPVLQHAVGQCGIPRIVYRDGQGHRRTCLGRS